MKKHKFYFIPFLYMGTAQAAPLVKDTGTSIFQMLIALVFVIGMIFLLVWSMKKMGYKGYVQSNLIKIDSCLPLSNKEKLLLVRIGDEQILIGTAPGFIGHIKTMDNPVYSDQGNSQETISSAFAEKLKQMMTKNKNDALDETLSS